MELKCEYNTYNDTWLLCGRHDWWPIMPPLVTPRREYRVQDVLVVKRNTQNCHGSFPGGRFFVNKSANWTSANKLYVFLGSSWLVSHGGTNIFPRTKISRFWATPGVRPAHHQSCAARKLPDHQRIQSEMDRFQACHDAWAGFTPLFGRLPCLLTAHDLTGSLFQGGGHIHDIFDNLVGATARQVAHRSSHCEYAVFFL